MINKFTVVATTALDDNKASVEEWAPSAYEHPTNATSPKILGVTMTDSEYQEPVAVMRRGYMRAVEEAGGESWSVGDLLWAKSDATVTNVRPDGPLPQVFIGTIIGDDDGGPPFVVDVNVTVLPNIGELSGVKRETPVDLDVFIYNEAGDYWEPRRLIHGTDISELEEPLDHPMYQRKHGFEVDSAGAAMVTLSYNSGTRKVTVTPTGATFNFWIDGVKITKTGAQETPTGHAASTGGHFLTYDATGTFAWSTTAWSILDRTKTPVAFVYYYTGTSTGICFYECHTADRWLEGHANLHATQGTKKVSGFALSGYTLATGSDAGVTMAIASGVIADEDIQRTLTAVADGGPYSVFYRTGANGDWTWDATPTFPFLSGVTYPSWNNINAGGAGVWGMTELSGIALGNYVNYYLCAVPSITAGVQMILIPGQASHASQASADAESLSSLSLLPTFPFQEIAPLYKFTFHARSTYGGTHQAALTAVTEITSGGASVLIGSSPSIHNTLSGRSAADAHPASSITNTPAGDIAATDVQSALNELDTDKVKVAGQLGGTAASPTVLGIRETGGPTNLTFGAIADGEFLKRVGTDVVSVGSTAGDLDDINDVNAPTPNDGDLLTYDSGTLEWVAAPPSGGISSLDDVGDVNVPSPSDGEVLQWLTSEWVAAPVVATVTSLDDVGDVNAPAPSAGDVLTWDDTPGEWVAQAPAAVPSALDDLTDVNAPTPGDGEVLTWDTGTSKWIAATASATVASLDNVGDVNVPTPSNGDVLTWDSTPGEWVAAPSTGGGGTQMQRFVISDPVEGDQTYPLFLAPGAGEIIKVSAIKIGTGTLTVNAAIDGVEVGSDVTPGTSPTWAESAAVAEAFVGDDSITVLLKDVAGTISYLVVQVDYTLD
jgi:hypothetical protein